MSFLLLSIAMQIGGISVKPMTSNLENITSVINEGFVSLYLYNIITISSGVDKNGYDAPDYWVRDFCGIALIITVVANVVFNILKFGVVISISIR
jgi:hypothetical protein